MRGAPRRGRDTDPGSIVLVLLVPLVVGACTHEVDRFQGYEGVPASGSIGTAPVGDEGDDDDDDDSSSDDGSSDGGATAAPGEGSAPADDGADNGSSPASNTSAEPTDGGGDTGSGDPVLDACLEIAMNECEMCACNVCLDPLYACQQDAGCVAMRDCAQQTGCVGADCLEPCGAVIDMYGGPFGESGALALALSDCLSASCPACF